MSGNNSSNKAPQIDYTARDFDTIREELEAYVQQTRPALWSDFFESNLGVSVIELCALVGDMMSYTLDSVSSELFLATARRYESALRFARSVGYVPRSATPAEVLMRSVTVPDTLTTNGGTVDAGASIDGPDGVRYELLADVTVPVGASTIDLTMVEGRSHEESFQASNLPDQEITTSEGVVAQSSWEVYVGDPGDPTNLWTQVDRVSFEVGPAEVYEVSFDGEGRLVIRFGDNAAGKIPDDEITVQYRTTSGLQGNVPVFSIRGAVPATVTGVGTTSVTFENSTGAATGGADRESLEDLRQNIPTYLSTVNKAITLEDYERLAVTIPGVTLAFADVIASSYSANAVGLYVWESEITTLTSESPTDGRRSEVEYTRYVQMPQNRVNDVREFFRTRSVVTVHNVVYRPTVAWADLYFGDIVIGEGYDAAVLHKAITEAIVCVFEDSTGFAIRVSDIYEALEAIEGVEHFYLERAVFEHLVKAHAVGTIQFVDFTQPSDGETITINDGAETVVFEFDNNSTVTAGNVPVTIGANVEGTLRNLVTQINARLAIKALRDPNETEPIARLTHKVHGEQYNLPIFTTGADITVAGMAGGSDLAGPGEAAGGSVRFVGDAQPADGDTVTIGDGTNSVTFEFDDDASVTSGNTQVTIGATTDDTVQAFEEAVSASVLNVGAEADTDGAGDAKLILDNLQGGEEGNVPITFVGANIAVTGMAGGTGRADAYREDLRRNQAPSPDAWATGTYVPGEPFVVGGSAWQDGGITPYMELRDLEIEATRGSLNYYDETYLYNNEIYYDSGVSLATDVQAINLRRLVFNLVTRR